ncbi:MAG: NAD(P)H-dependent oxidoreductase [Saprospiraceae bacterium]|nr:NAD(P)H-dependent oxidoreductase [Pyrinomonadaceae bacterium]
MDKSKKLKAVILLATLKKKDQSNTQVLSEFLSERLEKSGVACEIIKLVDKNVFPGTYSDMGKGDAWPGILENILAANIVIFATPVWWGGHSSEMQKVIERLDEIHDEILAGKKSQLEGKVGGIVVTGDSDGAQHIIGNISNFFNAVGILLPPYTTLTVLWEGQAKGTKTSRTQLIKKYEKEYGKTADTMVKKLLEFV